VFVVVIAITDPVITAIVAMPNFQNKSGKTRAILSLLRLSEHTGPIAFDWKTVDMTYCNKT